MIKKIFLLTIALLCAVAQGAWAESVTFRVRSWNGSEVVTTQTTKDATILTSSDDGNNLGSSDNQNDYYYVVKGNVSTGVLFCYGRVHIILADNATLSSNGGIRVLEGSNAKLHIYSQSDGNSEGKIIVTGCSQKVAGIGSIGGMNSGTIEIHGGNLDVTGGKYGAGIGAGSCMQGRPTSAGKIIIYGGVVKAQGGEYGAGIGGGAGCSDSSNNDTYDDRYSDGAEFYLYGGEVTATGGEYGAGVGGGGGGLNSGSFLSFNKYTTGGTCGLCRIFGGKLTATGGKCGAGIGGGSTVTNAENKYSGKIIISGGIVNATGGKYAAGIGGGINGGGGSKEITGGTVTAIGGTDGAGIGGGEWGPGGNVTIRGGYVRAEGRSYGAGIGGGESDLGGSLAFGAYTTITGGTVIAIAGEDCKARDDKGGSAIGCGQGMSEKDNHLFAQALNFGDNMRVTAGDSESNIERVFANDLRVPACRWRNFVKIEECAHTAPTQGDDKAEAVTYTIDGDKHTMHCRYCTYTHQENHTFVEYVCRTCGKTDNTNDDLWSVTLHRASAPTSTTYADRVVMMVVKDQTFTLPAVSATEGLTLMGYATSWTEGDGIEMKDGEKLMAVGTVVTPKADMNYYPRYRYRYVPTWAWDDDNATAWLSIKCSALSSESVSVSNITYTTNGEVKTATGTYEHNGATYTFTDTYLLPADYLLLRNTDSNEDNLDNYDGRKVNLLSLQGRTLYADGSWNTLCLPFSLSQTEVYTYLNPSALKTLASSQYDSETATLMLNFTDATTIEAGKPYLIKWTGGGNRTNPSFSNVTVNNVDAAVETDYVTFAGFFSPVSLEANDKTVLYLGAGNKLYYPTKDRTMGACRAVFVLNGLTAGDLPTANARAFVLNFGDGEATGIVDAEADSSLFTLHSSLKEGWYDMQGRRLSGKPTARGIYINNGKKVVIK